MDSNVKPIPAIGSASARRGFAAYDGYTTATQPPPPPDEQYWAALLREGEDGQGVLSAETHDTPSDWDDFEAVYPIRSNAETTHEAQDWEDAERLFNADRTVELTAIGFNRGGLLVEWNSLRGFVPASQLVDSPTAPDPALRRQHLVSRVNQPLVLRIIELDRVQNRLIFSERAAQVQPGTRAVVMDTLKNGDIISGQVTNLCDFGAFIDLGGLEGLIHISELSWGRVSHPQDILKRGQEVRVFVMEIHRTQGRIALSLKRLQPDPWQTVEARYRVGQMIEGVVTNIVDFGAFACIEDGLEGLIHISELAEGHFLHPRNVVQEGDRVIARILNIDGRNRRLGLSLREQTDPSSLTPDANSASLTD